ncbi:cytochrome P450 [Streptomyces sp. NPDC017941]|uniref:cytochrome P450 n=1 Tax=Streptomyces sp. NPDC017941 TaxID=3365018 RepID=UPI0037AD01D3
MLIRSVDSASAPLPAPPGPRLPRTVQTAIFTWWRHVWAARLRQKYGDVVALKVYPWGRVVLVNDAEHIAAMFASPSDRFRSGSGNRILAPVFGEHGLLTSDGEEHRRLRRLMTPMFGKTAVRGYQDAVRELTERDVETWPVGSPFASLERIRKLSLDIIWRVIFGPDHDVRSVELRGLLERLPVMDVAVLMGLNSARARRVGPWRRASNLLARIDALLYDAIEERGSAPDLGQRTDILSQLVGAGGKAEGLSPVEVRDQAVTLLFAGHEPTATALAWTLHELARNPTVAEHAARAALSGDSAYLEALVKEAMRRRTGIFESIWTLTEDIDLGDFRVRKGATLMPMLGVVHMDPAHYRQPEAFRPERFLHDDIPPHAFIPFGGGARRCIGAHLSVMQSAEVLRVLLSRRSVTTDRPKPEAAVSKSVTIAPARGARIILRPLPRTGH